jgi:hypothetical protein
MPDDALLAQNMNAGPGGKHVSKQRGTTWEGSDGTVHQQSFVFTAGDTLLFEAKNVRAPPLDAAGDAAFPAGFKVEVQRSGERKLTKDATVVSRQEDGTYTVSIGAPGAAAAEVLEGVGVSSITVPAETYKPGPIDERLIGHSKGVKQILMERGRIEPGFKCKARADPRRRRPARLPRRSRASARTRARTSRSTRA